MTETETETTPRVTFAAYYATEYGTVQEAFDVAELEYVAKTTLTHAVLVNSHGRVLCLGTPAEVLEAWTDATAPNL